MSQYPAVFNLQPNTYLTYIINTPSNTYSISPALAPTLNATLDTVTGRVIFLPQGLYVGPPLPTYTISNAPNPASSFDVNFEVTLNNTLFAIAGQAVNVTPTYAAIPPGVVTYSLYAPDTTDGLYPKTYPSSLPAGLTLNSATGAITGTPTAFSISPLTQYQIQINNPAVGKSYTVISLSVDVLPTFIYPDTPYIYAVGNTVNIVPSILNAAIGVTYSVAANSPGLPEGLVLNSSTGIITGVASNNGISDATYTITAIPSSGNPNASYSTTLRIIINKTVQFSYPGSPYELQQLQYAEIVPSNYQATAPSTLPTVQGWTILPALKPTISLFNVACGYDLTHKKVVFATSQPTPNSLFTYTVAPKTYNNPQLSPAPLARFATNFCLSPGQPTGVLFSRLISLLVTAVPSPVYDDQYFNDTWLYSTLTQSWTNVSNQTNGVSPNLVLPAYAMNNSQQVLVYGGYANYPYTFSNRIYLFDIPSLTWNEITPTPGPLPLEVANVMVYYPPTASYILFEGSSGNTWSFQGNTWTLLTPSTSPPSGYPCFMTYSSYDQSIYLVTLQSRTWRTWKYNGTTWTNIVTSITPQYYGQTTTSTATIVYASDVKKILFFQQENVFAFSVVTQTWAVVNNVLPICPTLTSSTTAAVNTLQKELLYLFSPFYAGGSAVAPTQNVPRRTYNFDLMSNAWSRYGASPQPNVVLNGMAYDSLRDCYWLANGIVADDNLSNSFSNQLWKFDKATNVWTLITPISSGPTGKRSPSLVYDTSVDKVVLTGGYSAETWIYDPADNFWILAPKVGLQPSARGLSSFIYDPDTQQCVLFGGEPAPFSGTYYNDLYAFNTSSYLWTLLSPNNASSGPPQAAATTLCYDSINKAFVLFYGSIRSAFQPGLLAFQTWYLKLAANGVQLTWTKLNVTLPYQIYSDILQQNGENAVTAIIFNSANHSMTMLTYSSNYQLDLSTITPDPQPINVTYSIICNIPAGDVPTYQTPPRGMTFDPNTGIISGTPTVLQPPFKYEIQATNTAGTTTAYVVIAVVKPYTGGREFTLCQDDIPDFQMRHKAEVLQHRGNALQLSRAQRLARAVTGRGEWGNRVWATQGIRFADPNTQRLPLSGGSLICRQNPIVCTPTYFSDVPGPVMQLCQNQALPPVPFRTIRQYTNNGSKWPQITTKEPQT
jgi:hypothetical protein